MINVIGERELTTNYVKLEIRKQSKRDLNVENLNLHHEKM